MLGTKKIDRRTLCSACRFPNDCTLGTVSYTHLTLPTNSRV